MRQEPPYILDTTVLIDVARRREPATSWLSNAVRRPGLVSVSVIAVAEFFAGVRPAQRGSWRTFFDTLTHWDVTQEIAIRGGVLRNDLARQGRTIHISDALIAATALVHGATLITSNIKDYPLPNLTLMRLDA
jgi:predicted nucleic acid-binding protein